MSLHPTSHITTPSAIFKLDNDTLLSIFDTITSQIPDRYTRRDPRPLTIVRAASQVCQRWRGLLFASPWIWGRLVDLDADSTKRVPRHVEWVEEIVRRAETAPLWIYGHVHKSGDDTISTGEFNIESYFMRLLDSWERIEKLSVLIELDNKETLGYIVNRFMCRAPILKLFEVYFSLVYSPLFGDPLRPGPSQCLFADYAPFLQAIKAQQLSYKPDSAWLSRIREIDPLTKDLTLQEMFMVFQHAPMIEKISIYDEVGEGPHQMQLLQVFPKLAFPHLVSMRLWASFTKVAAILDHISPGRLSALVISVCDFETRDWDNSLIPSSFKANLPSYISSYLATVRLTCVRLSMGSRLFRLLDASNVSFDDSIANFQIKIEANMISHQHDWDNIITAILDAFTEGLRRNPSVLPSATKLSLSCIGEVQTTIVPKLHSTLALFHHVQHLEANEPFLRALSSLEDTDDDPNHILLPKLHTLRLTAFNDRNACADLTPFVIRRRFGFPIAELDLTYFTRLSNYADALCALEAARGLEVVWAKWGLKYEEGKGPKILSHICGITGYERLKDLILG